MLCSVRGCRCKKGTECPERAPRRAKKLLKGQKTGVREWLRETGPFGLEEGRLKGDLVALQLPERRLQQGERQTLASSDERKWSQIVPGEA